MEKKKILSEEELKRIEENRLKALDRLKQKKKDEISYSSSRIISPSIGTLSTTTSSGSKKKLIFDEQMNQIIEISTEDPEEYINRLSPTINTSSSAIVHQQPPSSSSFIPIYSPEVDRRRPSLKSTESSDPMEGFVPLEMDFEIHDPTDSFPRYAAGLGQPPKNTQKCSIISELNETCNKYPIDNFLYTNFSEKVCHSCKKTLAENFRLISRTVAIKDFMISEDTFKYLPFITRNNPINIHYTPMKLYLKKHIIQEALLKHGDMERLEQLKKERDEKLYEKALQKTENLLEKKTKEYRDILSSSSSKTKRADRSNEYGSARSGPTEHDDIGDDIDEEYKLTPGDKSANNNVGESIKVKSDRLKELYAQEDSVESILSKMVNKSGHKRSAIGGDSKKSNKRLKSFSSLVNIFQQPNS
jgi:DNA-repair protein complementing XP-A cells